LALVIGFLSSLMLTISSHTQKDDFPVLRGPYLGQKPPGMTPEVFAPGIVSAGGAEFNAAFSPDGEEFYFSVYQKSDRETMMAMKLKDGYWTSPEAVAFTSRWSDCDPFYGLDGKRIYFISNRPKNQSETSGDWDIWYMEREKSNLSHATNAGPPVNSEYDEYYVSLKKEGAVYFASNRPGGHGLFDIYCSRLVAGRYDVPKNLGDESYLIFTSVGRPDGFGKGDLFVSFRGENETWT